MYQSEKLASLGKLTAGIAHEINTPVGAIKSNFGDIPEVVCYPGELNQVFMNILNNAAHTIKREGEISIRTFAQNGHINIEIADSGEGFSFDDLKACLTRGFLPTAAG